jgi:hypothetical protein
MKTPTYRWFFTAALTFGGLTYVPVTAAAQTMAFCALRDPVIQIYELFPEADAYRTLVRTIGEDTRHRVVDALPFGLHFNELGFHTVYQVIVDSRPIGLVHARSEVGAWGLIEVVWAFDADLRIRGFRFQRLRGTVSREELERELAPVLRGLDQRALEGLAARREDLRVSTPEATEILDLLVRSALKAIAVTRAGWGPEVSAMSGLLRH